MSQRWQRGTSERRKAFLAERKLHDQSGEDKSVVDGRESIRRSANDKEEGEILLYTRLSFRLRFA